MSARGDPSSESTRNRSARHGVGECADEASTLWTPVTLSAQSDGACVQEQVEKVIEIIRPAIQADGGDINLLHVDEGTGIVTVELTGACVSCPASTVTMKAGIERIMKDRVEGVTEVVQPDEGMIETGTAVSL